MELYQKICVSSCIRTEIRNKFFGINEKKDPLEPDSICAIMSDKQYSHFFTNKRLDGNDVLLKDIDYFEDMCPG